MHANSTSAKYESPFNIDLGEIWFRFHVDSLVQLLHVGLYVTVITEGKLQLNNNYRYNLAYMVVHRLLVAFFGGVQT